MDDELHPEVKPLTIAEKNWIARLEKCLSKCPSKRLALVTIGDASLQVIDEKIMRKYDLDIHDGEASRNGLVLADIDGAVSVHGVSG